MRRVSLLLAVLLCWTGLALADQQVHFTKAAAPAGTVEIQNTIGSLEIIGWDREEIDIEGRIGDDVQEVRFEVDDDSAEIEVELPNRKRNVDGAAHLTIHVPENSSIDVEGVSTRVTVKNLLGEEIEIESISGDVIIEDCRGTVDAGTISGKISVRGEPSEVEANTISGSITILGVRRSVEADTTSGRIRVEGVRLENCELEALSGDITYIGALTEDGELEVEGFNSTVEINFTDDVFGEYDITSFSGKIETSFGPEPRRTSRHGPPNYELKFKHGDGDARVRIETFNGRVIVKR